MANKKKSKKKGHNGRNKNEGHQTNRVDNVNDTQPAICILPALEEKEASVLAELKKRTGYLLSTMKGTAPDGAPFASFESGTVGTDNDHPLAILHASMFESVTSLMLIQKEILNGNKRRGDLEVSKTRDDPDIWKAFSSWLEENDTDFPSADLPVEIRKLPSDSPHSSGYGLFATRDIGYNETVLNLSVSCMMSPFWDHPSSNEIPKPPPYQGTKTPSNMRPLCLAMFLANEKWRGDASPFKPYLDTLPRKYSTLLYWSLEGIRELRCTRHLKRAVSMTAMSIWEYLQMRDAIIKSHENHDGDGIMPVRDFTYDVFRWALSTAHTRQNMIPFRVDDPSDAKNTEKGVPQNIQSALALVPLWDLINHEDSERACQSEVIFTDGPTETKPSLVCRTPASPTSSPDNSICYRKNQELKMYYGERSSAQLLFHSGFVHCTRRSESDRAVIANLNRNDLAIIRVALPSAERDKGLDRVREMIAARFGFAAYVDQKCHHEGMDCAAVAEAIIDGGLGCDAVGGKDERDGKSVVSAEFYVSPLDPCPVELVRAMLLCVADKEELNLLLRNMDKCLDPKTNYFEGEGVLRLGDKHARFAKMLVDKRNEKRENGSDQLSLNINCNWIDHATTRQLSRDLESCDRMTLQAWLTSFSSQCQLNPA